jgi:hypothetical protein
MSKQYAVFFCFFSCLFLQSNEIPPVSGYRQSSNMNAIASYQGMFIVSPIDLVHDDKLLKYFSEDSEEFSKAKKKENGEIAGFWLYTSFTILFTISGIPTLATGCYYYSIDQTLPQNLPLIIVGGIMLGIGGIMLALLIGAIVIITGVLLNFKVSENKGIRVRILI